MDHHLEQPAKGKLLVAEPLLGDPTFDRTVILLVDQHDEGFVGFVLNKPLDLLVDHLFEDFPEFGAPVFYGGPVQKESLYFIHTKGELIPDSIKTDKG